MGSVHVLLLVVYSWLPMFRGYAVMQLVETLCSSWKVTGSIPNGAIGIFNRQNPSDRTVALGSIQPLTEMSTVGISWEVKVAGA